MLVLGTESNDAYNTWMSMLHKSLRLNESAVWTKLSANSNQALHEPAMLQVGTRELRMLRRSERSSQ